MAKAAFPKKIIGIGLIVAGAGLLYWGYQKSEGLESQLSTVVTGSHTDNVMLMYIAGAVCLAIGAFLNFKN